MKIILKMWNI